MTTPADVENVSPNDHLSPSESTVMGHDLFRILFDSAPVAMFVCDLDAVIQHHNVRAVELWGRTPTCGVERHCGSLKLWLPNGEYLPHEQSPIGDVIRTGMPALHVEVLIERPDGIRLPVLVDFAPLKNSDGEITGAITSFVDITQTKKADAALRESEERLRTLAEAASDAIVRIDEQSTIHYVNSAATRIFGYAVDEMIGQSMTMLMPEEMRERHQAGIDHYVATGKRTMNWESVQITGLHKDGHEFPVEISFGDYVRDGKHFFIGIARDNSQRKEAERLQREAEQAAAASLALQEQAAERLKLQEERVRLLAQVLTSQADERRRISRDMHDHFGQQLTALRLQLESLGEICTGKALIDKVSEAREIAKQLDSDVSFLVWELRPADLDEVGLKAAITQYAEKWSAQFNMDTQLHVGTFDEQDISGEAQTTLYRIVQEALNNVQKYAQASQVSVLLERRGDELVLIVEDDGKGFDTKEKIDGGYGLVGMRERTALIAGTVEIESAPGKGTTIFVRIPIS